ncbi:MAG: PHP domain-containing protein, partial [Anaerovorax sp.]|nr:PHP domain-containing protein [Anaerovorax sp.]
MKTLMERYISWSKIGKHAKNEYIFSIGNAYIKRDTKQLNMDIKLNFIIPFDDVQKLKIVLQKEFPQLSDVVFHFYYKEVILSTEEIIRLALPHMIDEINGAYAHLTRTIFIDQYTLKDSLLQIKALGEAAVLELNQKTARLFEQLFIKNFGLELQLQFINNEDSYIQKEQEKAKLDAEELETIHNAIKEAEANAVITGGITGGSAAKGPGDSKPWLNKGTRIIRQKYTPVEGNRIMGEDIEGEAVSLKTLHKDSGLVIIEGCVFRKEARTLKSGRQLITLLVTDTTNSICVKIFANEQKWNEIDEHIKVGTDVRIRGNVEFDTYENTIVIMGRDMEKIHKEVRKDLAEEKRVELHVHTKMSAMDGLIEISDLVKTVGAWGHKALAITDHGVAQAFPDAAKAVKKNKLDLKLIFGLEGYLLDDEGNTSAMPAGLDTSGEYVVFDLETTGLSPTVNEIIEIGAVKVKNKVIVDEFLTFVKPSISHLPEKITELTGITDDMIKDAPTLDHIFDKFMDFIGELPLVAHNADFDVSFIRVACAKRGKEFSNPKVDTLYMARTLLKDLKRHKLNLVANALGVALENHHRAVDDAKAAAGIMIKLFEKMEEAGFNQLNDIEKVNGTKEIDYKTKGTNHIILLAKNQAGLKNIYELVSRSHLDFFYKKPRIPKSVLLQYREGIIIGSACEAGQVYQAVLNKRSEQEIEEIVGLYDYLEIQPLCNNHFLIEKGKVIDEEELKQINRTIISLGKKYGKPIVATCDAHYKDQEDSIYRKILMAGQGYKDIEDGDG